MRKKEINRFKIILVIQIELSSNYMHTLIASSHARLLQNWHCLRIELLTG